MAECDVVVAGHLCLDITPEFPTVTAGTANVADFLRPGALTEVDECVLSTGGAVSNVGIALHKLGMKVNLMGKVGEDFFGEIVGGILEDAGCGGARVVPGVQTSYTIVIAPPGIDRMFLHNPGANDSFCAEDVDFDAVAQARMLHLGYPPLLAALYADDGEQLVRIFRRAKQTGATTSLDMSLPDPEAASGRVDWRRVFQRVLPYVGLFVPSVEEVLYCLQPQRFREVRERADAEGTGMLDLLDAGDLEELSADLLGMGAAVVVLKAGHRGIYLHTADAERLARLGRARPENTGAWAGRQLWEPAYVSDRVVSATGAGDCAIAGFLAAFCRGESVERCLKYASAAGMQNVQAHDSTSGLRPWEETGAALGELPKADLEPGAPGWRWDETERTWRGPGE